MHPNAEPKPGHNIYVIVILKIIVKIIFLSFKVFV